MGKFHGNLLVFFIWRVYSKAMCAVMRNKKLNCCGLMEKQIGNARKLSSYKVYGVIMVNREKWTATSTYISHLQTQHSMTVHNWSQLTSLLEVCFSISISEFVISLCFGWGNNFLNLEPVWKIYMYIHFSYHYPSITRWHQYVQISTVLGLQLC